MALALSASAAEEARLTAVDTVAGMEVVSSVVASSVATTSSAATLVDSPREASVDVQSLASS